MKYFSSTSFKLALIYFFIFSTSISILIYYFYQSSVGFLEKETDKTIEIEIQGLAEQYQKRGLQEVVDIIQKRINNSPLTQSIYVLADQNQKVLVGNLLQWPDLIKDENGWVHFYLKSTQSNNKPQIVRAKQFKLLGAYHLIVGREVHALVETRKLMFDALLWGLSLTLLIGIAGGILLTRSVLSKVSLMDKTCRKIIQGDLNNRVPRNMSQDEFDALASTLNLMLDKIQELMQSISQVTNNIAHDLRTPLARLKQSLDSALAENQTLDSRLELISGCIVETESMINTFNALLNIAHIENDDKSTQMVEVNLEQVIDDIYDLYQPLAEEKKQSLKLSIQKDQNYQIVSDQNLLFQALSNILDNAIKFSDKGGEIILVLSQVHGTNTITLTDCGGGIPENELGSVFKPFYRTDSSRTLPGTGLGLSLVKAICEKLHIDIALTNFSNGLRVSLKFIKSDVQKQYK